MPSTGIVDGFAAREANGCCGQRGERLERPFAHLYETGRMRRVYLRGHTNIRKRALIHTAALSLGLLMRTLFGVGTPRSLQGGSLRLCMRVGPHSGFETLWTMYRRSTSLGELSHIARCVRLPRVTKRLSPRAARVKLRAGGQRTSLAKGGWQRRRFGEARSRRAETVQRGR